MAYLIVQTTDFKGYNKLAQNNASVAELQAYIDKYERIYLYKLFGQVLADLFIANVANGAPIDARFLTIFNAFHQQQGNQIHISEGIKAMLISMIEYHYITETQMNHGQAGVNANVAEVTQESTIRGAYRFAERKFNNALETYDAVRWYVKVFAVSTFPEYLGFAIKPQYGSLL